MKISLPRGQESFEIRELAELLAAAAQPIQDSESDDHSDYFDWAVALADWYACMEEALHSGQLRALHPVTRVPTIPPHGDSALRSYLVLRGVAVQWLSTLGQVAPQPGMPAQKQEGPLERANRLALRRAELVRLGDKSPTQTLAQEEGINASRVRQILQQIKPKSSPVSANDPFRQAKGMSKR